MKLFKLLIIVLLYISSIKVEAVDLSTKTQVSILTCGKGDELYSIFGHTAVRIYDSTSGMDLVFNYGTFDFETEGFYVKFVRGKLDYMLSVSSFKDFLDTYIQEDRSVSEQILDLTFNEKQAVFDYLENNYKGKNKYYKYDFFFDNCTTRIRDLLSTVLKDKLVWDQKVNLDNKTFREVLDDYIVTMPWVKFGFYLGLGSVTDRNPNFYEAMFLPDKLENGLALANVQGRTKFNPLVSKTLNINSVQNARVEQVSYTTPDIIFSLLLIVVLILSYLQIKKGYQPYWLDLYLWTNTSLAGILVLFLWFFTDHKATANNFNFLWANPIAFLAIGTILNKTVSSFKLKLQYILLIINLNLFLFSPFFFQNFHNSFLLIMLSLSIRAGVNIWSIKKHNLNNSL
jgi:hypothetical protein